MWKIWIIFSVFKLSYSAPVDSKEGSAAPTAAADSQALSCLFTTSPLTLCDDIKRYGNKLPKRLQKLYATMRDSIAEGSHDFALDSNAMHMLPATLLYVIPRVRLHNMTGLAAANILRKQPDDEALAIKLTSLLTSDEERKAFLEALPYDEDPDTTEPGVRLSAGVQQALGHSMAFWYSKTKDWQFWQYDAALVAGNPVLAHLPAYFLNRTSPQVAQKFLYHLRSWRVDYPDTTEIWAKHPQHIKRLWTKMALEKWERPSLWFPVVVRDAGYMFSGATVEEIALIVSFAGQEQDLAHLLNVDFAPLPARALVDVITNEHEEFSNVKSLRKHLPFLLPRQIQPFETKDVDVYRYISHVLSSSLPTQKQVLEQHIAHLIEGKMLPSLDISSWKDEICRLGQLVHLLPASSLVVFKNEELSLSTLSSIFSKQISFRQARYLTQDSARLSLDHMETILGGKDHLKAMPASELVKYTGRAIPEHVLRHLLRHIPARSKAITAQLLERVQMSIDDRSMLVSILENDDYRSILAMLSARDLLTRFDSLVDALTSIASEYPSLKLKIRNLPPNIGHMLLAEFRRTVAKTEDGWTLENLVLNHKVPLLRLLLSNLQCADIDLINDVDVVPILGYYVRERRDLGLAFPKNMQYCGQKALTRYVALKSSLQHNTDESIGLTNLMEIFEVKAVGGYILSSLEVDAAAKSFVKFQMLVEIGALPLPELLTATPLSNLHRFANSFSPIIDKNDISLREVLDLGNLIWYLEPQHIRKWAVGSFRLMLESKDAHAPKAPCLTLAEREVWREYLVEVVGKPTAWSSGTLAMLGDLLYVFDETDLDLVPVVARVEAADVLSNFTSFHQMIEWPGKLTPISYYEACLEALPANDHASYKSGVRSLLRFYLESSQMLLQTVMPAKSLLKIDDQLNTVDSDLGKKSDLSSTEHPGTIASASVTTAASVVGSTEEESQLSSSEEFDDEANLVSDDSTTISSTDSDRIKRAIPRRKISKRVLTEEDARRNEVLANCSRALVIIKTDANSNEVHISETFPRKNLQITCDAIKMLGISSSLVLDVDDLKSWSVDELEDCAEVLGSLNLPTSVKKSIWRRLGRWKESQNLLEVGNLVSVIEEEELAVLDLDVSRPWALESLSALSEHLTASDSLDLIRDRFQITNQHITSLTFGSAAALGRIVCQMSLGKLHKMLLTNPGVFVQTAPVIGATVNNDYYCIDQLIGIAKTAYGKPETWSAEDVASMGVIASGLTVADWKNPGLKLETLAGLTPAAVSHIPPEVFKELSEDQLSRLAPLSVAAISPAQSSHLSPSQSAALERVRRQIPHKDLRMHSSASSHLHASWAAILVLVATVSRALV